MSDQKNKQDFKYENVGEIQAIYSVGNLTVTECPYCHALVLWASVDAHTEWHFKDEL